MAYSVKILLDSVNPAGSRLITWELTYPRFVHAELMTHRLFSRSSASSRAIPTHKMRARIAEDPVLPVRWIKNEPGMQGYEDLPPDIAELCKKEWLWLCDKAIGSSAALDALKLHKGLVNRVTEPWMWITVIMTSTFHANWFALRDHPMADLQLSKFATEMHAQYWKAKPKYLAAGKWHMPLMDDIDQLRGEGFDEVQLRQISAGRVARVSYLNHDGIRKPADDLSLFTKLSTSKPGHMAPFEHVAQSMNDRALYANFCGWKQMRKDFENEAGPPEPLFDREGNCILEKR